MAELQLILAAPPDAIRAAAAFGQPVAHMAYRLGLGGHLFRSSRPVDGRNGLMLIDDSAYEGQGDAPTFCKEVLHECQGRGFRGAVLDFAGPQSPLLIDIVFHLSSLLARRGLPLYVPEAYGAASDRTRVLISTALSGGSLHQRLSEAIAQYGAERIALDVERVAEDFSLPAPEGRGKPLTPEALSALRRAQAPAVFFSSELCSHYFTYMAKDSGAHFVLFDDEGSLLKKLRIAAALGIRRAFLFYPQVAEWLPTLLKG